MRIDALLFFHFVSVAREKQIFWFYSVKFSSPVVYTFKYSVTVDFTLLLLSKHKFEYIIGVKLKLGAIVECLFCMKNFEVFQTRQWLSKETKLFFSNM